MSAFIAAIGFIILMILALPLLAWAFGHYGEWMFDKLEERHERKMRERHGTKNHENDL